MTTALPLSWQQLQALLTPPICPNMGNVVSQLQPIFCKKPDMALDESKKIDKRILQDLLNEPDDIEVLLLGTPGSGKSTFLKQIRILHKSDFTLDERLAFKCVVWANIIHTMSIVLNFMERKGLHLESEESEYLAHQFYQLARLESNSQGMLTPNLKMTSDLAKVLLLLGKDKGVRMGLGACQSCQDVGDGVDYYFRNLERILDPSYIPTTLDILNTSIKTSGVVEVRFAIKEMVFRIHNVGDQKSGRKKWLDLFDCVHAVIFFADLSTFDHILYDDTQPDRNSLRESLKLFGTLINNTMFVESTIIVFLNKIDIFRAKLQTRSFHSTFHDFMGNNTYDAAIHFVADKFREQSARPKQLYIHNTCTTDTNNIRTVLESVTDLLVRNFLQDYGIY